MLLNLKLSHSFWILRNFSNQMNILHTMFFFLWNIFFCVCVKKGMEDVVSVSARRLIGSMPPRCETRCRSCGHCEAIQVPIVPLIKNHGSTADHYHHLSSTPTVASSRGDDISNYKPICWKCKCGDFIFNPWALCYKYLCSFSLVFVRRAGFFFSFFYFFLSNCKYVDFWQHSF